MYGNTEKQLKIVKVMKQILRNTEILLSWKKGTETLFTLSFPLNEVVGPWSPATPGWVAVKIFGYAMLYNALLIWYCQMYSLKEIYIYKMFLGVNNNALFKSHEDPYPCPYPCPYPYP